jgi:hypothetical protein
MFETPVAMLIFRRPEMTERVFKAVAQIKPHKLLVSADGPRPDVAGEADRCKATRAVIDRVDWDCEVIKNYSDSHLGCSACVGRGISWIFETVEEAIILEDDCVPHPSFFRYCEELLRKYRDDQRIMHISGSNFLRRPASTPFSYFFSCLNICWGWASWRRAWRHFDIECTHWPLVKDTSWLADIAQDDRAIDYWMEQFDTAYRLHGDIGTWDHQWTFACWANSGLSILPSQNLISNIGCCEDATHTHNSSDIRADLPTAELEFPLKHPPIVTQSTEMDRSMIQALFASQPGRLTIGQKVRELISYLLPGPIKRLVRAARQAAEITRQGGSLMLLTTCKIQQELLNLSDVYTPYS